eukprot:TRINITY_DN5388_c0_g2_i1.p1 TRINITY_DN5388_c0_g2~~TRINITY_DN5388_c0_g2_i1.p1  ORF type:complete len:414 (+),score=75.08 TRINITY_DN5388_c0_g2_i1:168-1409(+)
MCIRDRQEMGNLVGAYSDAADAVQLWLRQDDWAELKGYLRTQAKLPYKRSDVKDEHWSLKRRWSINTLLVLSLVLCVGYNCSGLLAALPGLIQSCYLDAWADTAGVDTPDATLSAREMDAQNTFLMEEHTYWERVRPSIMDDFYGQWVAVVGGKVVSSGHSMNKVAAAALKRTKQSVMYVARVGYEDEALRALQATVTGTDSAGSDNGENAQWYPMANLPLRGTTEDTKSLVLNVSFLVDTGADLSAVTPGIAARLHMRLSPVGRVRIAGWSGSVTVRQVYLMSAWLAGREVIGTVDVDAELCVLGRDILNDFELLMSATHKSLAIRPADAESKSPSWETADGAGGCERERGWWSLGLEHVVEQVDQGHENRVLWYAVAVQSAALFYIIIAPRLNGSNAVSYTHLTLPTKRIV